MPLSPVHIAKAKLRSTRPCCIKRIMFSYCSSRDSESLLCIRDIKEKSLRREVKFSIASASFSEPIWSKLDRRMDTLSILQYSAMKATMYPSNIISKRSIHAQKSFTLVFSLLQIFFASLSRSTIHLAMDRLSEAKPRCVKNNIARTWICRWNSPAVDSI